jgi:hypothetical protein
MPGKIISKKKARNPDADRLVHPDKYCRSARRKIQNIFYLLLLCSGWAKMRGNSHLLFIGYFLEKDKAKQESRQILRALNKRPEKGLWLPVQDRVKKTQPPDSDDATCYYFGFGSGKIEKYKANDYLCVSL